MTEKRFTYEYDECIGNLFDNKMNTFYQIEDSDENIELLCNRLNKLNDENKQFVTKCHDLEDKNEQLKQELTYWKELLDDNLDLQEENEQLKQEKQLLYENIDFLKKFIEKQGFKVKLDDKLFRVI